MAQRIATLIVLVSAVFVMAAALWVAASSAAPMTVRQRMIAAAEQVARLHKGDAWPNCPDPHDGSGASWDRTKRCESPGYPWRVDPPGYYCGPLQIDPKIWWFVIARWRVPC